MKAIKHSEPDNRPCPQLGNADGSNASYSNLSRKVLLPASRTNQELDANNTIDYFGSFLLSQLLMQSTTRPADPLPRIYDIFSSPDPEYYAVGFRLTSGEASYYEQSQPWALYDGELGWHAMMLAVDRSFATQQSDEAL